MLSSEYQNVDIGSKLYRKCNLFFLKMYVHWSTVFTHTWKFVLRIGSVNSSYFILTWMARDGKPLQIVHSCLEKWGIWTMSTAPPASYRCCQLLHLHPQFWPELSQVLPFFQFSYQLHSTGRLNKCKLCMCGSTSWRLAVGKLSMFPIFFKTPIIPAFSARSKQNFSKQWQKRMLITSQQVMHVYQHSLRFLLASLVIYISYKISPNTLSCDRIKGNC